MCIYSVRVKPALTIHLLITGLFNHKSKSMSLKASVFIAISLDGFIARKGGELDWLDAASATVKEGEDSGYNMFFESIDVLIMGRKTYEKILSFSDWPYGKNRLLF